MQLQEILGHIEARRPFVSIKINHGYWERLVRADEHLAAGISDPVELDNLLGQPFLFVTDYLSDMQDALDRLSGASGNVELSATPYAWPASRRIGGMPRRGLAATLAKIRKHVHERHINDDGLIWKQAVYDGSIRLLFDRLRDRSVVLVGPPWLLHLGDFAGIPDFRHEVIDPVGARGKRHEFIAALRARHDPSSHLLYLVQAGSFSPWLGARLMDFANASVLDIGLPLNLCHFPKLHDMPWAKLRRHKVADAVEAINPQWPDDPRFYGTAISAAGRRDVWRGFRNGFDTRVASRAGAAERPPLPDSLDRPDVDEEGPVSFIENKRTDFRRVEELLEPSRRANQWANYGPVSRALETHLAELMKLHPDKAVVMASSGTAALFALAGLHAAKRGRKLHWLVSAYSFPCQRIGPFHGARMVDCDKTGLLDLALAAEIKPDEWDGMVVTNLFGRRSDLDEYRDFCKSRGKTLLVDGATALFGVGRSTPDLPDEMISFHQTKPWGAGEGGCAIVARDDVDLVRSLLSFGIRSRKLWPFASNGKMAEVAAAIILERLERLPEWQFFYDAQQRRIATIARRAGLKPFRGVNREALVNSLPFKLAGPVDPEQFGPMRFPTHKYYRPLDDGCKEAKRLFERMLNVPCHPGMAAIPTGELEAFFARLAEPDER